VEPVGLGYETPSLTVGLLPGLTSAPWLPKATMAATPQMLRAQIAMVDHQAAVLNHLDAGFCEGFGN
jgi:hypothetical protein